MRLVSVYILSFAVAALCAAQAHADLIPRSGSRKSTKAPKESAAGEESTQGTGRIEVKGPGRFEFHARNLAVTEAFGQLRQLVRKNIVLAPEVTAQFTGDVYDLTADEIIDVICLSTGLTATIEGSFIYIAPASLESRVFRLNYARAEDILTVLAPLSSREGKITATKAAERGIKPDQEEAGSDDYAESDLIVVQDFPRNLERIAGVIEELDVRPRQVLIEARILAVSLTDDNALGVDFVAIAGTDFRSLSGTSSDGTSVGPGVLTPDQLDDFTGIGVSDLAGNVPTGGLSIGILKNDVGLFIRALQQITDSTLLANPKILALNKQRGEVIVGRRDGYRTTTVTQTASIERVEFLETGTRLIFRPYISDEGYVRLEIHPEDSTGGVSPDGLPFKQTAEVTSNILLPNGHTAVIGGLFRERVTVAKQQVPVLGSIPWLGALFRTQRDIMVREEVIILLTPRIVGDNDEVEDSDSGTRRKDNWITAGFPGLDLLLCDLYKDRAKTLAGAGKYGSANALLNVVEALQPDSIWASGLKRKVYAGLVDRRWTRQLDDLIVQQALAQTAEKKE